MGEVEGGGEGGAVAGISAEAIHPRGARIVPAGRRARPDIQAHARGRKTLCHLLIDIERFERVAARTNHTGRSDGLKSCKCIV